MKTKLIFYFSSFAMGGVLSELLGDIIAAKYQFIAVFAVVLLDAFFTILPALRNLALIIVLKYFNSIFDLTKLFN